jgi:hypothetical protein
MKRKKIVFIALLVAGLGLTAVVDVLADTLTNTCDPTGCTGPCTWNKTITHWYGPDTYTSGTGNCNLKGVGCGCA